MRYLKIALMVALVGSGLSAVEVQYRGAGMSDEYESADALLDKADSTFQSGDLGNALQEYQRVLDLAQKEFNRSVETETLAQIARLLLKTDKKEEGRQWLTRAGARADDSDPMGYSRYLGVKGRFEWQDGDLSAARKTFDE
ncbi:MAG: hypothetical protein JSU65_07710, partial [Candidatus Zixiibacteriota bacterium]